MSADCDRMLTHATGESPFSRVIVLDYYDGPTSGAVWCQNCMAAGIIDLLAWDDQHHVRVFSLACLPEKDFGELIDACSGTGPPQWTVWVPIWKFESESARIAAERRVDEVLSRATAPTLVFASPASLQTILAAREVTPEELGTVEDWFAFLGLVTERTSRG